jgi:hypothetical protein
LKRKRFSDVEDIKSSGKKCWNPCSWFWEQFWTMAGTLGTL